MAAYSSLQNVGYYGKYTNITADALIATGPGQAIAIIVASHTSGAISLADALTNTTPLIFNTYTYASGSQVIPLYGLRFTTGLYANVTNTQDITIVWNQ